MKKKVLFISGGGTKIVFLSAVALTLIQKKKLKFQHFVGVSSGAIISLLLALGKYDQLENEVMNLDSTDIFNVEPKSLQGKLKSLWNTIRGETYLYDDSALKSKLMTLVTKDQFNRYQRDENAPKAYVLVVDINNGTELLIDLKLFDYEIAIDYVMASTSIPVFVKHKTINGRNLFDGGLRSHIGSATWLKKHVKTINESYSIYSRPRDLENITWKLPEIKWFGFGMVNMLDRTIEILNLEISKSDEREADIILANNLKRNEKIFAPYKLMDSVYDNSPEDNARMWNLGIEAVEEEPNLRKEI